jgi:hypothetical protein
MEVHENGNGITTIRGRQMEEARLWEYMTAHQKGLT